MKKVLSFLLSLSVAAAAFSCSSSQKNVSQQSYTAEKLSNAAYKKELLKLPEGTGPVYLLEPMNGGSSYFILGGGSGDGKLRFLSADSELDSFTSAEISYFDIGISYMPCITDDGTLVELLIHADYGDLPPVDIYSEEYMENQEKYDAAAEYSFMINRYSVGGELLSSEPVKDYPVDAAKDTSLNMLKSDGEYVIAEINGMYELFEIGGKYIGELSAEEGESIEAVGRNGSGELVCAVDMGDDKLQIRAVNKSDGTLEKSGTTYNFTETPQQIIPAYDEYSLYIRTTSSIYGIRSDNGDIEALFSFSGTGVKAMYISSLLRHPDGDFIIVENDYTKWTAKVNKFTPCDPSELENVPRITLALANSSTYLGGIEDKINDWNAENGTRFKVELKNYYGSGNNFDTDAADDVIRNDALSGNLPDIIYSSNSGDVRLGGVNLLQFDAFCDLYEFMDSDEELSRDSFVPNVLPNLEIDGKLPYISTRFSLDLGYVVKSKFYDSIDDWGVDAYLDFLEKYTDESTSKWDRLRNFYWNRWVNTDTLECNFNTPQFIRFLKYCDDTDIIEEDYSQWEEYSEYDIRLMDREALYDYVEDRKKIAELHLYKYADYAEITRGQFGGEPITILGSVKEPGELYMSFDGYTFAITKTSQNKELAWEFIKTFFSDSELENYQDERGYRTAMPFPVTKSALKLYEYWDRRDIDYAAQYKGNPYFEEYPEMEEYHGLTYTSGGLYFFEGIPVGSLTDEDVEAVNDMIARATVKGAVRKDVKLYGEFDWIGVEEINRFFAGECTAEQCAAAMEDRCSTYLAEHYS